MKPRPQPIRAVCVRGGGGEGCISVRCAGVGVWVWMRVGGRPIMIALMLSLVNSAHKVLSVCWPKVDYSYETVIADIDQHTHTHSGS